MGRNMEIKRKGDFEYKLHKQHKISEYLENEATEWVIGSITDHFEVELIEELTIQQIEEVVKEYENCDDQYIAMALRNSISQWENDNDQYVL